MRVVPSTPALSLFLPRLGLERGAWRGRAVRQSHRLPGAAHPPTGETGGTPPGGCLQTRSQFLLRSFVLFFRVPIKVKYYGICVALTYFP